MRAPLVLAVAQPPCAAGDVAANAMAHAQAVRDAGARVVVFPELSLTGYELDAAPVAPDDPRLAPLVEACHDTGTVALVGAPVSGEGSGRVHIGILAVIADGVHVAYRKMWLGGDEPRHVAPGTAPAVHTVDGWRLGLAVCKDTGVAQHVADTAALGIDAYVAGAVDAAEDAHVQAERAVRTARAHSVWVAVASFAGPTGGGYAQTAGRSAIWSPDGALVAQASAEPGEVARATMR